MSQLQQNFSQRQPAAYPQTSKRRVAHVVPVDNVEDIDTQLIGWIRASYLLIATA